jgi:hypothetical protein
VLNGVYTLNSVCNIGTILGTGTDPCFGVCPEVYFFRTGTTIGTGADTCSGAYLINFTSRIGTSLGTGTDTCSCIRPETLISNTGTTLGTGTDTCSSTWTVNSVSHTGTTLGTGTDTCPCHHFIFYPLYIIGSDIYYCSCHHFIFYPLYIIGTGSVNYFSGLGTGNTFVIKNFLIADYVLTGLGRCCAGTGTGTKFGLFATFNYTIPPVNLVLNNFSNLDMSSESNTPPLDDYVDSDDEAKEPGDTGDVQDEEDLLRDEEDDGAMETEDSVPESGSGSSKVEVTFTEDNTVKQQSGESVPLMPPPPPPPTPPPATTQPAAAATAATQTVSTACGTPPRGRSRSTQSGSSSTSTLSHNPLPKAYYNIKAAKQSSRSVRTLSGCADKIIDPVSSFIDNDANYVTQGNHRHNYTAKQNISTSFSLTNFVCNTCAGGEGGHVVLHREGGRVVASDLAPVAFVLSDQNFPPAVPVQDQGECLKIFRIEDASPQELVAAFLEATRGFIVPAGSVVSLSSASFLAWVGVAAYARDFIAARARLRAAFRGA